MELARVFADNMVLQRRRPICIWGICDTAQMVTARLNGWEICQKHIEPGELQKTDSSHDPLRGSSVAAVRFTMAQMRQTIGGLLTECRGSFAFLRKL